MKKTYLFVLPLLAVGMIGGTVYHASSASITVKEANESPFIKEEYEYNSTFEVPTLIKEGKEFQSVFVFPDGTATNDTTVILTQCGTYKIHYSATINGTPAHEDYSFIVKNQYYSFNSSNSFASYENSDRTYEKEGLYVYLDDGDTISFTQEIDLTSASKSEDIIDFFAAPESVGKMDFSELDVVLTDVSNSDNYLKVRFKYSPDGMNYPYTYVDGGGNGQDMVGVEGGTTIHSNNQFGCAITHSFYGVYSVSGQGVGINTCVLNYDVSENAVYTNHGYSFVTDMDNSKYYSTIWDGFKTGIVKMSLTASGSSGGAARFVIKSAKDLDLKQTIVEDTTAPEITVNSGYTVLPHARIGGTYPIFPATATDNLSGEVQVDAKAYYLKNGKRYSLTINHDNKSTFPTEREGEYEIVYRATDGVGNEAVETLNITTSDDIPNIVITPRSALVTSIKRGNKYTLPDFKINGGTGNFDTEYEVLLGNKPVTVENNSFVAREMGVYTINFYATDVSSTTEKYSYQLLCVNNTGVAFETEPELPKYFLSNYNTTIPALYGVHYGQNGKSVLADVELDNGITTTTIKSGEKYTPVVTNSMDPIKVTYKAEGVSLSYSIPCVTVFEGAYIKVGQYFISDTSTINTKYESYTDRSLISSTVEGDSSWEFANALLADSFLLTLRFNPLGTTYSSLKVTITDKLNANQSLTVNIEKNVKDALVARVNDNTIKTDIEYGSDTSFSISYGSNTLSINKTAVTVSTYDDGTAFAGFDSRFVYLTVTMKEADLNSSYFVETIGNQTIAEMRADRMEPMVAIIDSYGGYSTINDTVQTARIVCGDVLDPSSSAIMSATTPEHEVVVSDEGVVLNEVSADTRYSITVNEYGQYSLNYYAYDSRENEATFNYSIGVLDDEAPVITITSGKTEECLVGEYIIVPNYTVTDNVDEACSTYVTIITPFGGVINLPTGSNCYKAKTEGTYTVIITAIDTAGNISKVTYTVNVKKGA